MAHFAVEEFDCDGYKKVHIAGCKDLRDPEVITDGSGHPADVFTNASLWSLLDGYGVIDDPDDWEQYAESLAPCATKVLGSRLESSESGADPVPAPTHPDEATDAGEDGSELVGVSPEIRDGHLVGWVVESDEHRRIYLGCSEDEAISRFKLATA